MGHLPMHDIIMLSIDYLAKHWFTTLGISSKQRGVGGNWEKKSLNGMQELSIKILCFKRRNQ